ncbi:MAG: 16S rRNA (guanine(527)-N(7))-methyltransferase RsmG [Thiobacillaceae bacterium]|jgi:16S rRNA (guanine527-N7)-methyltransferase|nr:16S rRNA (guanine(527)-N(7))-methyltransferase RsmG [Hydrogenophilales bacterium]MBP8901556.1 16S rRNA (guanine(527)-N(7))-methyltransferase RsmG [Thiobacillaceae bacterium]MBP9914610.1 16S rRNA (guanine(527)-N(7))-methyltransferase RsmG [Thiobacillaceae bacterium]
MNLAARLADGVSALGLDVDERARAALLDYLGLLEKWNKTYNLTAIHEPERMLTHHLLDSLIIAPQVGAGPLLDVGSGAGLPGIPLAIARPGLRVTLLDASQKKCGFMRQAAIDLKLSNVTVTHARVEDFRPADGFPQVVSRAFSDLSEFVRLTRHLVAPGGEWLAMKGLYPHEEIAQLKGARVTRDVPLRVPGLDADRHLIVMEPV